VKFPKIARLSWGEGYPAARMLMNEPLAQATIKALEEVAGLELIKLPLIGGSTPLYLFPEILQAPGLILPIVNHDNNQHAENENLRLQNLWYGVEAFAALFSRFQVSGKAVPAGTPDPTTFQHHSRLRLKN
ncbi:MAG: M20/M25/M40 family metallo-hydrolase, partial [Candidatus Saccharicenans sp.]|nr:M20/M25/M40 family metallo-hydrolase [Candidatus Saccharicenans sp.]